MIKLLFVNTLDNTYIYLIYIDLERGQGSLNRLRFQNTMTALLQGSKPPTTPHKKCPENDTKLHMLPWSVREWRIPVIAITPEPTLTLRGFKFKGPINGTSKTILSFKLFEIL